MEKSTKPLPPCHGIIPARFGSTRFPGKPLADIAGKPMFWHVFSRASRCRELLSVTIATDSDRIADAANSLGVPVMMTRSDHPSGTDRVKEAADKLNLPNDAVIVNIQGDEPLLDPGMLTELISPFERSETRVTTLAHQLQPEAVDNPDRVKVVFDFWGRALYFSRSTLPFCRDGQNAYFYGHIGLYAFRKDALDRFVSLDPGRLEQIEKLEQLRLLENRIPIDVVITERLSLSVDRPEDLEEVIRVMASEGTSFHD